MGERSNVTQWQLLSRMTYWQGARMLQGSMPHQANKIGGISQAHKEEDSDILYKLCSLVHMCMSGPIYLVTCLLHPVYYIGHTIYCSSECWLH